MLTVLLALFSFFYCSRWRHHPAPSIHWQLSLHALRTFVRSCVSPCHRSIKLWEQQCSAVALLLVFWLSLAYIQYTSSVLCTVQDVTPRAGVAGASANPWRVCTHGAAQIANQKTATPAVGVTLPVVCASRRHFVSTGFKVIQSACRAGSLPTQVKTALNFTHF